MILANVSQINLISNYVIGALSYEDKFSYEKDGFLVGAAITNYDSDPEPLWDPRHGELILGYYTWGDDSEIISVG